MIKVICNTSPLIALTSIEQLPLLWKLFDEVIIPQSVYDEICFDSIKHRTQIQEIKKAINNSNISIYTVKNQDAVKAFYGKLHFGELEVIVGAKELQIQLAIIDERAARKLASDMLIDTIGIIGILILAKQRGLITSVKPNLDKLISSGYRISEQLYTIALIKCSE